MPRWPLLALVALVLAVPAASAARQPCWKGVLADWYDNGKLDRTWSCRCLQEAIARSPQLAVDKAQQAMEAAEQHACANTAVITAQATRSAQEKPSHVNWPARISASVLLVVTLVLLIWRRRQRQARRARR